MPPPDFIPKRSADTGPQRPMSATELHFPVHHTTSERPMSGPQRVIRPDGSQAGTSSATNAIRTGPIRPAVFSLKSEDGPSVEKKERVVGGARRVLRMPETTEPAEDKGKTAAAPVAPASKPVRPRVISTSKSTPAIPLQAAAVREEAAKKLASSAGASSRGGTSTKTKATTTAPAAKPNRTASSTLTQPTAGSKARVAEKGKPDVDKAKIKVPSKVALPAAPRAGPGTSITVRDRAARAVSKSKPAPTKPSQRAPSKPRSSPEVPEVAPAEVPLPESPKVSAAPSRESSPPPLISLDTPENSVALPAAPEPTVAPAPTVMDPVPNPADIPLPSSTPGELSAASPSEPTIVISEPHTPTPQRPSRRAVEVEQTPISALVASIQRGFLSMNGSTPLSPMREEDESVLVLEEQDNDGKVFAAGSFLPAPVAPLFSRPGPLHA